MSEKMGILYATGTFEEYNNPIAFEIFPKKSNIVDDYDIYHIWLVEQKEAPFLFLVKYPLLRFNWKKILCNDVEYEYKKALWRNGTCKIYFLKRTDGTELSWYQKQHFKDLVIGEDAICVEIIQANLNSKQNISILIQLPENVKLPFGLKKRAY